ncbi:translocation/assembly module TamB domain-containing protein [Myxosarcina sp. GI1]|uniref:translocation/assembly module TamB domain-containing protein n=1 Tax=Myxosarcina sp. GI1 TaxID=1541065 RepID=UPI00056C0A45|nr:translocation/assembly module TamB domain-containing protein [Myxosarcina sp. GI1]
MTSLDNRPPNPDPDKENRIKHWLQKLKPTPKQATVGVVAIAALAGLGYWGIQYLAKNKLSPFLETQISNFIDRPIDVGEVESFSLFSGITVGETTLPATETDPDNLSVEEIEVDWNLFAVISNLIFRQTLPVDVSLVQPEVYVEENADGEWLNLDFLPQQQKEKKEPLLKFNVGAEIEEADITAVPYNQEPIEVTVDGSGQYNQGGEQLIAYDLDATIQEATATLQGETILETGKSDTKLLVEDLALSDVTTLLPNSPVALDSGILNADLDIDIPSFEEFTSANVEGMVSLQNVSGEATNLDAPVSARSQLDFGGRDAQVTNTQATLGDIVAQVAGQVNLDTGYDLNVEVQPFSLASIPQPIKAQLPVNLGGEVTAQLQVEGAIKDPLVTGKFNNTRTLVVDKTQFETVAADFTADLSQIVLENLEITPVAGGAVTAAGVIETNIKEALEEDRQIDTSQMPVEFNFQAELPTEKLARPYYQFPQEVAVGDLNATGEVRGTVAKPEAVVNWRLPEPETTAEAIYGSGAILFSNNELWLRDTSLNIGEGEVEVTADANLDNKQWQAELNADNLYLTPYLAQFQNSNLNLERPIALNNADVNLNGRIDQLNLDKIKGAADLQLAIDGGDVSVDSQLNEGNLQARATTSGIPLDNLVNSLPVETILRSGNINLNAEVEELLSYAKNPNLNSLNADADLQLGVDGETVAVDSQINRGNLQANVRTGSIDLNRFAPALPVPANLNSSNIDLSARLEQLLTFAKDPDLSSIVADVNADLTVAEGRVDAIANLNNNQWQANVDAVGISSALLIDKFAPKNLSGIRTDNINAQVDLSGAIDPVINNQINVPVTVSRADIQSGVQNISANGNFTLSEITSNLDVANANLDVNANVDFDRLPIDQIVAQTTQNNELIANSVNLRGDAVFDGQFQGQNLISAPTEPGNVALTGNLRLQDLAFNDVVFDPVMAGDVNVRTGEIIALNLQGQQDVIAASAEPCTRSDCKLPYIPTSLELRQGEDTAEPVIATGNKRGDVFDLNIVNFPLAVLNLAPGQAAGIQGALGGEATGDVAFNLYNFATDGEIAVERPGVGYIQADRFNANFAYNPAQNIAEISSASLDLDNSRYNLNAALDLQTGAIDGRLGIPEAYIQDVLTTFRWFTIQDLTTLFNTPDYASVEAVRPAPERETVGEAIAEKLLKLRRAENRLQEIAAAREAGGVPTQLDIQGRYTGEITFGGTISTPQASYNVEGNNWQWQPQPAYVSLVQPLGLVKEEREFIAIPEVLIRGGLEGTVANVEEARVQVQDAVLSLSGQLSPDGQDADFQVENLTVDNIANFVNIPVDVSGEINAEGSIEGTLPLPDIAGTITFTNGAFNGNILPTTIAGNFNYGGEKLDFETTQPSSIQVDASIPYPIVPGENDRLTAKADLTTEAFTLLGAFSQGYLSWVDGEGDAQLEANARLDLDREQVLYDLDANGVVNLNQAEVALETPFFSAPFKGSGKITIDNQIVNVETMNGTFAEKDLSVSGSLPILTAVNNLEQPLTVNIPEGEIAIEQLYKGDVAGEVTVTGAALEPTIGGRVALKDGTVSIPKNDSTTAEQIVKLRNDRVVAATTPVISEDATDIVVEGTNTSGSSNASSSFVTKLNDLQISFNDLALKQTFVYYFQVDGDLTLNGTADQPTNIIPKGTINLTDASVDLLNTKFVLADNRDNTLVFTPEAGLFNPYLDIQMKSEISQPQGGARLAEAGQNEISDPISQVGRSDLITIFLNIDGETEAILPDLGQANTNCIIRPNNAPLATTPQYYTEAELNRLTTCFNDIALNDEQNSQIINSPAVELTSIPTRSQGEIVSLLGDQFIAFAEQLQNSGQSDLSQQVTQFVVEPVVRRGLKSFDNQVVSLGKKAGLDYLRLFPYLEGIYEIDKNSTIRGTYRYGISGLGFSGVEDQVGSEGRIEYQLRF